MKKSIKSTKNFIYKLSEKDKEAIKRVYELLYEIENDMEANDVMEVNDGELFEFQYSEIEEIYDGIIGFLRADTLNITREIEEESEL